MEFNFFEKMEFKSTIAIFKVFILELYKAL